MFEGRYSYTIYINDTNVYVYGGHITYKTMLKYFADAVYIRHYRKWSLTINAEALLDKLPEKGVLGKAKGSIQHIVMCYEQLQNEKEKI